jgi:DNA-binding transcriptional LysR family regulator
MRFDLVDLKLFCDIVEAGAITRGAERSALALGAASTRLKAMEDAVDAPLLIRSRRGVSLTPAGATLLKHARLILAESARLREDLGVYAGGAAGHVRLLANTNASTEFLPEALSDFLAANPKVTVDLEERLSDEIVALIAEGVGDIGIVAGTVDMGRLQTFPFRSDRFVVVTGAGHDLSGRQAVAFADVLGFDFVGLDRASALQRFLAAKATPLGQTLRLRVQLRSFDAVCRLVAAGVGIGVVPLTTARRAALTLPIVIVDLEDNWAIRELTICLRDLGTAPPYARELVRSLRAVGKPIDNVPGP